MKTNSLSHPLALSLFMLTIIACNLFADSSTSPTAQPTATQTLPTEPGQTETAQATATVEVAQGTTVTSSGPSCTVLQDLNLRFGPGTAYRPPIRALPVNSVVTPLGFVPQGIPGGSWAYVEDTGTQDKGWVSAGSQYISCNVELASLPAVEFGTPPPPPLPKSAQTSDPDGNGFCVDLPSDYQCVGTFSEESFFRFQIFKNGVEQGQDEGMEPVSFTVSRISPDDPTDKEIVFEKTENQRPYCIFGDSQGVCNSWISEAGVFKWTSGGTPVEPGAYEVEATTTLDGNSTRWAVTFTLTLP